MSRLSRDPLLAIARGVLWFLLAVFALAGVGCLLGLLAIPVISFNMDAIIPRITTDLPATRIAEMVPAAGVLLAIVLAIFGCMGRIVRLLLRVVDTVDQGDPFVPQNARRLTQMAWLALAVELLGVPAEAIGAWISRLGETAVGGAEADVQFGFSASSLILVLILFILARVFRKGAEMRADLEGMV